jgi:dolichol kinase
VTAPAPSPRGTEAWRTELLRKGIHLSTASLPLAWASGLVTSAQLRLVLSGAVGLALGLELLRRWSPVVDRGFMVAVGGLLRRHERDALTGATWLAIAMAGVVWLAPERAALAALWAAAVGDASAALVGRTLGARRKSPPGRKSWEGSVTAALSTALGCVWLAHTTWPVALVLGAVAALAEFPRRPFDDNLRVATAVAVAASALGLR